MLQAKSTLGSVPARTWTLIAFTTISLVLLWLFLFRSNSSLFPTNLSFFPAPALMRTQSNTPKWQPQGRPSSVRALVADLPPIAVTPASIALLIVGETPTLLQKGLFHLMNRHLLKTLSTKGSSNVHTFVSLFDSDESRSPKARDNVLHRLTNDLGSSVQHITIKNATCNDPEFQSSSCCSSPCGDPATCFRFHAIQSELKYAKDLASENGFTYDWFVIIQPNVGVFDIVGPLDSKNSPFLFPAVSAASKEERLPADYFLIVPSKLTDSFVAAATASFSSCIENDSLEIPFFGTLMRSSTRVETVDLPLTLVSSPTNKDKSLVIDGVECYRTSLLTKSITRPLYSLQQLCVHSAYSLAFRFPF